MQGFVQTVGPVIDALESRFDGAMCGRGEFPILSYRGLPPRISLPTIALLPQGQGRAGIEARIDRPLILERESRAGRRTFTEVVLALLEVSGTDDLQAAGRPLSGILAVDPFTLLVPDLSPDSVVAAVLLIGRLQGRIPKWDDGAVASYVGRWRRGDVKSTGTPYRSFGAVMSALTHSSFAAPRDKSEIDPAVWMKYYGRAWLAAFRLTVHLLDSPYPLHALPEEPLCEEHARGLAWLRSEEHTVRHLLKTSDQVQLSLPFDPEATLWRQVDACFLYLGVPVGSLKNFLRSPPAGEAFGNGCELMVLLDEAMASEGGEMVISVDPSAGADLMALWRRLEREEDEAWQGRRPRDNPRVAGDYSYDQAPNQPWFINPERTLVASPLRLVDGSRGSKLGWERVKEVVWEVYHPLAAIRFEDVERKPYPIDRFPVKPIAVGNGSGKWLASARVAKGSTRRTDFQITPTVERCLAAVVAGKSASLRLSELPHRDSYDVLELPGGLAVVQAEGVFLLDDQGERELKMERARDEVEKAVERLSEIARASSILQRIDAETKERAGNALLGRETRWLSRLAVLKRQIGQAILNLDVVVPEGGETGEGALRAVLYRRWRIGSGLEDLYIQSERLEERIRGQMGVRTSRIITLFAIFGFPPTLFATLSTLLHRILAPQGEAASPYLWGGGYVALTLLSILVLLRLIRHREESPA